MKPWLRLLTVGWALSFAACTTVPKTTVDEARRGELYGIKSASLSERQRWRLSGKLAISSAGDGGSGTLNWRQEPDTSRMDFYGALGRGAWRLDADDAGARLQLADGTVHEARTVDRLVREQLGWELPVGKLAWWVRGMSAPGAYESREIDEEGNMQRLVQDGWTIEFTRYKAVDGLILPVRMTARQADWTVKLAVRDWSLAAPTPQADGSSDG